MTNASKLLAVLFFVLFAAGCARSKEAPASATAPMAAPVTVGANVPPSQRSRIVTMDVAITVDHFDDALSQLRAAVDRSGGYVSDMHAGGAPGEQTASIEIRVPADKAGMIRGSLGQLGEITNANEKVEDVTEERADLDARITNARTQEKRLLEIMEKRSGSIADLVENEKELARVRETIERLEAQQRSLVGKIDLATIKVSLMTRQTAEWKTPGKAIAGAAKGGLDGAQAIFTYGAVAFLTVAPTILPLAGVLFAVWAVIRRRRAHQIAIAG